MDKDRKEYLSHKYFNDIKIKNLKSFEAVTPKNNIIKGVICKKANRFLGSMVIEEIVLENGEIIETEQFVQAMPKIHYYDYNHQMFSETPATYPVFEKLDGSCLILYGLYNNDEVIEVVPKTRGVPVADSHIIDLYDELDHANIEAFFDKYGELNPTLLFELFGTLNQHSVFYPRTRIDISFIGAVFNGSFADWYELDYFSSQFDFYRPKKLFSIVFFNNVWKIRFSEGIFFHYAFLDCSEKERREFMKKEYPTQADAIQGIKDVITRINNNFLKIHGRELLEGVVVNSYNSTGDYLMYLKIKPVDVERRCRTENGVPRKFVLKEVHKYFDEYGSRVKEIFLEDENHYKEYVNRNLLEEFDLEVVNKKRTQTRIQNVFFDMLEAKEPPIGLQEICNDLRDENPDLEVSDLMRLFAQKYPEKKRQASAAYSIFESIV